jgi:hypothetical protein
MKEHLRELAGDELGRDVELGRALAVFDPGAEDESYWQRFRGRVSAAAVPELMRRRLMIGLTVSDVLHSWARTVVPTAMVAATLAALLLIRSHAVSAPLPLGVEEMLVSDVELTIPMALAPSDASLTFIADVF